MKIIRVILILLTAAGKFCFPQDQYNINIKFEKISDKVVIISGSQFSTNQAAIYSDEGIILIDTGISPEYALIIKDSLNKIFNSSYYRYIINTHHHWDHVQGNQVFTGTDIVAHMNCEKGMRMQKPVRNSDRMNIISENGELPADSIPPPPPSHILINGENGYLLTVPSIMFNDRIDIRVGNITLYLLYYGECHTDSDIIIYIPEFKLLSVGDLFFKNSLPQIGSRRKLDINKWLNALSWILTNNNPIDFVVPGHYEMLTKNELQEYYEYLKTLSDGIGNEILKGTSFEDIKREYSLENKFPSLLVKDMVNNDGLSLHNGNIKNLYDYFVNMSDNSQ